MCRPGFYFLLRFAFLFLVLLPFTSLTLCVQHEELCFGCNAAIGRGRAMLCLQPLSDGGVLGIKMLQGYAWVYRILIVMLVRTPHPAIQGIARPLL